MHPVRFILMPTLLVLLVSCAAPEPGSPGDDAADGTTRPAVTSTSPTWTWTGIELMGNRSVPREEVLAGAPIEIGGPFELDRERWTSWAAGVKETFDFHAVHVGAVRYVGGNAYLVVDVVERGDEAHDSFRPAPTGHVPLPDDVLALYGELRAHQRVLFEAGTPAPELGGAGFLDFAEPTLSRLANELARVTPPHRTTLLRAIAEDADGETRATAATLLNWAGDVERSILEIAPYLDDPSSGVRNNLTRFMLHYLDRVEDPAARRAVVDAVIAQLHRPSHGDRNKALYALQSIVGNDPEARAYVHEQAGDTIAWIADNSVLFNVRDPARSLVAAE